jgi:hypothetical protein
MIKWVVFFAGCFFCFYLNAQSGKQVRTYGIKAVTETVIEYEDGKEVSTYISSREVFDKRGEWIERTSFKKDGSLDVRTTRKYDRGEIVEETEEEGPQNEKKGHDGDYKKETYVYDKGDVMEKNRYDKEGNLEWREVYTYNKYGDKVREERLTGSGKLKEVEVFTYDLRGLRTAKITTDSDGQIIEKSTYAYEIR